MSENHLPASSIHRPGSAALATMLREARIATGLTQAQAAGTVGITESAISDLETTGQGWEFLVVRDLVSAYGLDWLGFVGELERRLAAAPEPATVLIRRARLRSGQ